MSKCYDARWARQQLDSLSIRYQVIETALEYGPWWKQRRSSRPIVGELKDYMEKH